MGIIDIDDRDVINNFYTQPAVLKAQEHLNTLKSNNKEANLINLGEGRYKIEIPVIDCTGSDVDIIFQIPFMHVFEKMELKHTTSTLTDSIDALTYTVSHRVNPNLWLIVLSVENSVNSDIIDEYANFQHERGQYKITSNSTNTDKLYISVYIKFTGD